MGVSRTWRWLMIIGAMVAAAVLGAVSRPMPPARGHAAVRLHDAGAPQAHIQFASLAEPMTQLRASHPVLHGSASVPWGGPQAPTEVFDALRRAAVSYRDIVLLAQPVDDDSVPLYAYQDDQPMALASTTKIVTTLAALDTLGPQYRWRTRAYLDGQLQDGILYGDLWVVGGGDARLTSAELVQWFDQMRQHGLREIRGNIVLDRRLFQLTDADHANTPVPSALHPRHNWPDALWVDEGKIRIDVSTTPAGKVQSALVSANPDVEVVDRLALRQELNCAALHDRPQLQLDETAAPMRLTVSGPWAVDCPPLRLEVATMQPAQFVIRAMRSAWHAAGGQLDGDVIDADPAVAPVQRRLRGAAWATLESPPLAELVRDMNKSSNNLLARHLMLSLADRFPSRPATLEGARKRVDGWLRAHGLADADLHVDNGSGLSYTERGHVRALVQLLRGAWVSRNSQLFRDSLPVAGKDGTLVYRLRGLEPGSEALLKTGSLNQARALAGYVRARSGRTYAMAAVINHANAAHGEPALDAFVEWIVRNG